MKNEVYYLPDYFNGGSKFDTNIYYYRADRSSAKNKVIFSQNLICILLNGTKEVFTPREHVKIENGQLLFLPAGSVLMMENVAEKNSFESILLFFNNAFLTQFCLTHEQQYNTWQSEDVILTLAKDEFIRHFQQSLQLLASMMNASIQRVKIEELLLYLLQQYPEHTRSFIRLSLQQDSEYTVRQVVSSNLDKNLTIDELAFLCNMSSSTFKRRFSEVYKTSPKKYFTDVRMQRAQMLLKMGKSASDISLELGYESLSSFSNEFKKYFGASPRQFHKEKEPIEQVFEPKG